MYLQCLFQPPEGVNDILFFNLALTIKDFNKNAINTKYIFILNYYTIYFKVLCKLKVNGRNMYYLTDKINFDFNSPRSLWKDKN